MPSDSRFSRALLLGLAFACNLGGMITPIASPQNAIALVSLQQFVGIDVSFLQWMLVAGPIALFGTAGIWLMLLLLVRPDDCAALPKVVFSEAPLTRKKKLALAAVAVAVTLWAFLSAPPLKATFGDPAIVGVALVAFAFGSGFLDKASSSSPPWREEHVNSICPYLRPSHAIPRAPTIQHTRADATYSY